MSAIWFDEQSIVSKCGKLTNVLMSRISFFERLMCYRYSYWLSSQSPSSDLRSWIGSSRTGSSPPERLRVVKANDDPSVLQNGYIRGEDRLTVGSLDLRETFLNVSCLKPGSDFFFFFLLLTVFVFF